jgi:5-methylcytosine-specific restriction endonuclease McrA
VISLPQPPAADDEAYLKRLCEALAWNQYREPWLESYAAYLQHRGNPWFIAPANFTPDIQDKQRKLYETRKRTKRFKNIRETPGLLSCPMCGSPTTGSLDHYLPRSVYPEFAVMAANLVPACTHCNSVVKGDTFRGNEPERFIHPYFDAFADSPLWQVNFNPPYAAVTFIASPLATLALEHHTRVDFHLKHVLGTQFFLWAQNQWATFPYLVIKTVSDRDVLNCMHVTNEAKSCLHRAIVTQGTNSWLSAFFRGLVTNAEACEHIASITQSLTATLAK